MTTSAIVLEEVAAAPLRCRFAFDAACEIEPLHDGDGKLAARVCRRREGICGSVEISAQRVADGAYRVRALISNDTPLANVALLRRDDVLLRTCVSTHAILGLEGGEFVSLLEPPEPYRELAAGCRNSGVWPVLAGREGDRTMVLASPIILYDHPAIAPESAGDLFDGAEIDELLTLRILSLTDDEKRHMRSLDDRTREILERTEMLPQEQMEKLHGAIRGLRPLHEAIE